MMKHDIRVWFEWILTKANVLADALSRYDFKTFWKWVDLHKIRLTRKPIPLVYYKHLTFNSNIPV